MHFHKALSNITKTSKSMTLFMAPMGWGKTRSVWGLLEYGEKIIFISPLRSIVEELSQRPMVYTFGGKDKNQIVDDFIKLNDSAVLAITPESIGEQLLLRLLSNNFLFVIDEFHLVFDWGESFRERLINFTEELIFHHQRILALSASIDKHHIEKISHILKYSDYETYLLDVGNYKFNNNPKNFKTRYFFKSTLFFMLFFKVLFFKKERMIIFVKTRRDVFLLQEKFREYGVSSQTCIGGEVSDFSKIERVKNPRIIISTSALSHGVNFKAMTSVFVLFKPCQNLEFQMFGRGGRFGEEYRVYGLRSEKNLFKEKLGHYANAIWTKSKAFF